VAGEPVTEADVDALVATQLAELRQRTFQLRSQALEELIGQRLEDFGVSAAQAFAVYNGVKVGGQSAWDGNAALKAAGEKRILKVFPTDPTVRWEDWKRRPGVFG
jgi:hypothetical protein